MISLGLGLLSIGRSWGFVPGNPPTEADASRLLDTAIQLGVKFFDTAPAYGTSEQRLGAFLRTSGATSHQLTIATKMGEYWMPDTGSSVIDHSYDALCRGLDRSLSLLGRIDLLQLHKATRANITADDTLRALDYARSCGIRQFGASVSDLDTARSAIASGYFNALQFPFNSTSPALAPVFRELPQKAMTAIINRPLAMGRLVAEAVKPDEAVYTAIRFILDQCPIGTVLTGTRNPQHLRKSVAAFSNAVVN